MSIELIEFRSKLYEEPDEAQNKSDQSTGSSAGK
jgi:hypothetical protein